MQPANSNRPFEGAALTDILHQLARINVIATSLKYELDPLSDEDEEAGAEPLTPDQIKEELDEIATIVTEIALNHVKAHAEEWIEANDEIE